MIQETIKKVTAGIHLDESEMMHSMSCIMDGGATDAQIASFITALSIKGETIDEITGAARAMREKATIIPVGDRDNLIDIVGTGGDMSNTFNISTVSSFIACGAGLRIAKHGNRSVSSRCGSADVLEHLGVAIDINPEQVARCIDEIGLGFLFAQKLHPAMKYAARARKEIGIRTIFNILGPLTNPAGALQQVVGVYDGSLTEILAGVLSRLGLRRALVVHGLDGIDEITTCDATKCCLLHSGEVSSLTVRPETLSLGRATRKDLEGGNPEQSAQIARAVLQGDSGAKSDIACLNAGAALWIGGRCGSLEDGLSSARESIRSGNALKKLEQLIEISNSFDSDDS